MSARSGLGVVVVVVGVLALVGVVVTGGERRNPPAPARTRSIASEPRDPAVVEAPAPVAEPASDPIAAEPAPSDAEHAPRTAPPRRYRDLAASLPAGTLEVLVLDAREPLAEATVRVRATQSGELFESPLPGDDERVAFTNAEGIARFEALDPAHYMIGVQTRDGRLVTTYQLLRAARATSRQVVALGAGGVAGRIHALDGAPLASSRVLVGVEPAGGAARICIVGETDADGNYRLGGVYEGRGRVYSQLGRAIDVKLEQGGWQRADFGSELAPVRWSGTLRGTSGTPCEALDKLVASEIGDGEGYFVEVAQGGGFELTLPPGSYRVWANGDPPIELGTLDLEVALAGQALARDWSVPGVTLSGRVIGVGDELQQKSVTLTLERNGGVGARRECTLPVGQRYSFAGLEAGAWVVTVTPFELLGARGKGLEVKLDDRRDRATLDLLVSGP